MSTVIAAPRPKMFAVLNNLVGEARRRSPVLFGVSVAHLLLLALMLAVMPFDAREVLGLNLWIKPIKFAVANTVYMLTLGWLLFHAPVSARARRRVEWLVAASMIAETLAITFQAARGTTSHFNMSSWTNAGVLALMGVMILVNTAAVVYVAWRFWRGRAAVSGPYLWGVRLGLLIFLLAGLEGFVMIGLMSHTVGAADGGAGLPFVNWSTRAGDLRVAHFVGMHALQALPLAGHLLSSTRLRAPEQVRTRASIIFGALYGAVALLLFVQALTGRPLVSL